MNFSWDLLNLSLDFLVYVFWPPFSNWYSLKLAFFAFYLIQKISQHCSNFTWDVLWYTHKTSSYWDVQLQNVQLQNIHLPDVQLQNVQITKRPDYQTSLFPNVQITKRPVTKRPH